MELTPDEILERAKKLNDDARRQLVNDLRQGVELGEVEFDEREEHLRLADEIEALCKTPDTAPAEPTDTRLSRAKAQVRTMLKHARRDGCAEIGPLVDKLKAMPDQQGVLQMLIDIRDEQSWLFRDLIVSLICKVAGRKSGLIRTISKAPADRSVIAVATTARQAPTATVSTALVHTLHVAAPSSIASS